MSNNSVNDIAIVQSRLFGDGSKGGQFDDLKQAIGYPANMGLKSDAPIVDITVMSGSIIDGIKITYHRENEDDFSITHGTSAECKENGLNKSKISIGDEKKIIAISGKHGNTKLYGTRVTQLSFAVYDSYTGDVEINGPYGAGKEGESFCVTANGDFVSFGGFAIDTNSSVWKLKNNNSDGGLYGLVFSEVAYRKV